MNTLHFSTIRRACLSALLAAAALPAWSQGFPSKPVRFIVPFTAGSGTDVIARTIAEKLGPLLGAQIVIDNKTGAGGTVGAALVAKAPADGYTLLFATMGTMTINPALYAKLRYDPVNDFAPVALTPCRPKV